MVILDGRLVYSSYWEENVINDCGSKIRADCIILLHEMKTFTSDTGFLKEVKVHEVKKNVTLSQLYAEHGVGVKFRFIGESNVYEICGEDVDREQRILVLDALGETTSCYGNWHVEPL